jgi:MoxR-like ATPase
VNTATTNAAWKNYRVGAVVEYADGTSWTITEIENRQVGKYTSRYFHLRGPNGETDLKTSRGLSLCISGASKSGYVEAEVEAEPSVEGGKTLAEIIAEAVANTGIVKAKGIDREAVEKIVEEKVNLIHPRTVDVVRHDGVKVNVGVQHVQFDALLAAVAARRNVWLIGPAGSGKTHAVEAIAKALGLEYHSKSVGPQTSESALLGYHDYKGECVLTQLRKAVEHGGVFALDEADAGNPGVLVVINQVLANGSCGFPDGVITKHPDFVLIACANTIGQGADRQYVGRQQIDGATLDRFVFLDWAYDPQVEAAACGVSIELFADAPRPVGIKLHSVATEVERENAEERVSNYVRRVVAIRNSIAKLGKGVRVIAGRSNINGAALLRAGWPIDAVLDACVWKGLDADTRSKIEANIA